MSLTPINDDNFEISVLETHPSRSYSSRPRRNALGAKIYFTGSNGRLEEILDNTGSVKVFGNTSPYEKEAFSLASSTFTGFSDDSLETLRQYIAINTSSNKEGQMVAYLDLVNASTQSLQKQAKQEIIRFTPTVGFTSNTLRKTLLTNHLMPYYRTSMPSMNFNVTNYNSLHFFQGGLYDTEFPIPSSSVLLYPNPRGSLITSGVYDSDYGFKAGEAFSFDFWIKPTHTTTNYKAGCIFHLTGAYALSLHSGSFKDQFNRPTKFKLMLQLGSGTYVPPSQATEDSTGGIYVSDDNVLTLNKWHHITVNYRGSAFDFGSGSFFVDTVEKGTYSFASPGFGLWNETVSPVQAPAVLCVGNFFNGPGIVEEFFNNTAITRDGLLQLSSGSTDPVANDFDFSHPLSAEVHDLKIYSKALDRAEIADLQTQAPTSLDYLKFYVPPFFTEESPYRRFVGEYGGILKTPFQETDGTSTKPFAAELAFGTNGHYINLENYVRDFATGRYPRLWHLTASSYEPGNNVVQEANAFLYSSGSNAGGVKRRLYTIMPCDHGDWDPNFSFLENLSGSQIDGIYSNDFNNTSQGMISLRNIVTGAFIPYTTQTSGSIVDDIFGAGPEPAKLVETSTDDLVIYNRLRDGDSNQVVVFDVSNLFYGNQILPKSIVLSDPVISGSDGKFGMILRDDGLGNLYRADATGVHATWASIGNVFYDEGLILIKSPQLYFFGSEGFDITFKGMHNIHVMTINCYARSMELVSSSNPSYDPTVKADEDLANENDQRYVYITGINIHDENLNVIGKTALAQPVLKKTSEKMVFKWSIDF